jgi:hypothetical protein
MKNIIDSIPMLIWLPREGGGVACEGALIVGSTVAIG